MTLAKQLLAFLKSLADANRLHIVGLLAHRSHSVEELAEVLGIRASTISHHLKVLRGAGVVTSSALGHYHVYSLAEGEIEARATALLTNESLRQLAPQDEVDAYERTVLATFLDAEGRLRAQPAKRKKFQVILRHALRSLFADEGPWPEAEVNRRLYGLTGDVAAIRRGFIDHSYMTRTVGGAEYAKTDRGVALDW